MVHQPFGVELRRLADEPEVVQARSEYFQVMRRENIPADELMGRRMEIGLIAVLAQLGAKRNWHRIMREWIYGDAPETELGRQEWEYFETRGVKQVPLLERTRRA